MSGSSNHYMSYTQNEKLSVRNEKLSVRNVPSIAITIASDDDDTITDSCIYKAPTRKKHRVPPVTGLHVCVVLEELHDQLDALGRTMGPPELELRGRRSIEADLHLHRPKLKCSNDPFQSQSVKTINLLQSNTTFTRPSLIKANSKDQTTELDEQENTDVFILKQNYNTKIPRYIRQKIHGSQSMGWKKTLSKAVVESGVNTQTEVGKTQADRGFLQVAVHDLMLDLLQNSSCAALMDLVASERKAESDTWERAARAAKDEDTIRQNRTKIKKVKQTRKESENLQRLLWNCEDDKQEVLMRKKLENSYTESTANMMKQRIKKQVRANEKVYFIQLANAKDALIEEERVHHSMMDFINAKYKECKERLEHWIQKSDIDRDLLQYDLETMKENREKDLERTAWLRKMIADYLEICIDDRRLKAIVEARRVRTALELKSCIKLQAWWRGSMVRHKLGPFKPQKPKKAKDEGKGKDGKDKKKK